MDLPYPIDPSPLALGLPCHTRTSETLHILEYWYIDCTKHVSNNTDAHLDNSNVFLFRQTVDLFWTRQDVWRSTLPHFQAYVTVGEEYAKIKVDPESFFRTGASSQNIHWASNLPFTTARIFPTNLGSIYLRERSQSLVRTKIPSSLSWRSFGQKRGEPNALRNRCRTARWYYTMAA
jgi:hypothetical protein